MLEILYEMIFVEMDMFFIGGMIIALLLIIVVIIQAILPSKKANKGVANFKVNFKYIDYPMNQTICYTDDKFYAFGSGKQEELLKKAYPIGGVVKDVPINFVKEDNTEYYSATSLKDCKVSRVKKIPQYNVTNTTFYFHIFFEEYEKCEFPVEFTNLKHKSIDKILVNEEGITFANGIIEIDKKEWNNLLFTESAFKLTFYKEEYYKGKAIEITLGQTMDENEYDLLRELIYKYGD